MDTQVGRVLEALEASGVAADTTIIYTSDHGETLGMRGHWGKSVLYRESTQVPLILRGPGLASSKLCSTPISLIDLPPTFLDHFGVTPPADWPGESLLRIVRKPDDPDRLVFSEYHAATSPSGGFVVANARWKYHYYVGFEPELFDLKNDPDERVNLAASADHRTVVATMHSCLNAICDPDAVDARAKRTRIFSWQSMVDRKPHSAQVRQERRRHPFDVGMSNTLRAPRNLIYRR